MSPRNHPCSCGSGRKYKRCHGALVESENHDEHILARRRYRMKEAGTRKFSAWEMVLATGILGGPPFVDP